MKKWRVRLLKTATIALVAVFLLVMSIRIQQFTVRKRAEQLEKELLALEYGKTTYDEVRPLLDRWHADFGGSNCSNVSCNATIVIGDFVYKHPALFSDRKRFFNTYGLLGGRPFMIRSKISIRNNVLFYKSYGVYVEVIASRKFRGWIQFDWRGRDDGCHQSSVCAKDPRWIPRRMAGRLRNLCCDLRSIYTASGCSRCQATGRNQFFLLDSMASALPN